MDSLESLVISGMMILKYILDKLSGCVGLIHLAEDTDANMLL
jgi:hypothetical protein